MPTISVYVTDELYAKLTVLVTTELPTPGQVLGRLGSRVLGGNRTGERVRSLLDRQAMSCPSIPVCPECKHEWGRHRKPATVNPKDPLGTVCLERLFGPQATPTPAPPK